MSQPFHKQTILEYLWQFPIGINIWISNFRGCICRGGKDSNWFYYFFNCHWLLSFILWIKYLPPSYKHPCYTKIYYFIMNVTFIIILGAKYGGYTCGVWSLWHFLTVKHLQSTTPGQPTKVIRAMIDYVR